jgi:cation diffusion facilitator family transporter
VPEAPENIDLRISELKAARLVLVQTLALNSFIAAAKIVWGFISNTLSMAADGFHSLLDASSNVVGIFGLSISMEPPDEGHPYGHRKFEALSAIAISFFMFMACFQVLSRIIERILSTSSKPPEVSSVSYLIMIGTAVINYLVSKYEAKQGAEFRSELLLADSKHTMSDLFVTGTVLVALVAVQLKAPALDVVASLIIVAFIFKAGYDIIIIHLGPLVDAAILAPDLVEKLVLEVPGVKSCHRIRSRGMKGHIFLDLHVQVPKHLSIEEAHQISFLVEDRLKSAVIGIADVLVHLEDDGRQLPGD